MNIRFVLALLLVSCITLTACTAGQNNPADTPLDGEDTETPTPPADSAASEEALLASLSSEEKTAEVIARVFAKKTSTYAFDGSGLTLTAFEERTPGTYDVTYTYTSSAAGYGDRSDVGSAQVLTEHELTLTLVDGAVVSALLDARYNELTLTDEGPTEPEPAVELTDEPLPVVTDAAIIATDAVRTGATYSSGGSALTLTSSEALTRDPTITTHTFTFEHAGKTKTARVVVNGENVVSILIDNQWNELRNAPVSGATTNRLLGDTCGVSNYRCGAGLYCLEGDTKTSVGVCVQRDLGFTCSAWQSPTKGVSCFRSTITNPGADYVRYNGTAVTCSVDLQGNCVKNN